jgi:membrane protein DedA with SNARE-associated domain
MQELIATWGYAAVFTGAFLEGETVLIIAAFLASGGHLELASVIVSGFAGGLAGDQFYFYVGRARVRQLIERRESWRPRLQRIEAILARHGTLLMLGYRFMYGVRLVTPLVLGAFGIARLRFLACNLVNAAVWSAAIASLGYVFGEVVAQMFEQVRRYELFIVIALAFVGLGRGSPGACTSDGAAPLRGRRARRPPPTSHLRSDVVPGAKKWPALLGEPA